MNKNIPKTPETIKESGICSIMKVMKTTLQLQSDYSAIENGYQLWIPLDCSIRIPEDDPVRLLNAVAERMDYRAVEAAYSRYGRIEYSPKILTKILVYGYKGPNKGRVVCIVKYICGCYNNTNRFI